MKRLFGCFLALAFLSALPILAAPVGNVESGVDVWWTPGDGSTFISFDKLPIPKGFFCPRSKAFTGTVVLRGRPLATARPGELGGADTIVQRLDNVTFDKTGVAETRIQLRALQLQSVAPIKTGCGDFNVQVVTDGEQPITKMRIIRERENGGSYVAPVRVKVRLSFTPASGISQKRLDLFQTFTLLPATNAQWGAISYKRAMRRPITMTVDTDGDQVPDTVMPKTVGNFLVGLTPELASRLNDRSRLAKTGRTEGPGHTEAPESPESPTSPGGSTSDHCGTTNSYEGYGDYECSSDPESDPSCHPEAELVADHCPEPCKPCADTIDIGGTFNGGD